MMLYTIGVAILLSQINLWNISLLKDTILWFCFTGFVMFFSFITSKEDKDLFRKTIVNTFKVVIIIEFIVNTYTFPLIGELVLIPVLTIIVLLETVAQTDKKFHPVAKLMRGFQIIIGAAILIFAASNIVSDYETFGSIDTVRSFLLPPLLTILFLPFLYFLVLFATYENLFVWLNLGCEKSKKLKRYAKREIIKYCLLSLKKVRKASNMRSNILMQIRNADDVDKMIKAFKSQT